MCSGAWAVLSGPPVFLRARAVFETLRRSGASEIRIDYHGAPVTTTAYTTHDRPFMRHAAYNWRSGTFDREPPAFNDNGE
jgi:hypothetical protein